MTLLGLNIGGEFFELKSLKVLVLIVIGLALSVVFYVIETKVAKFPVMPTEVFKNRSNAATIAVGALHALAMMGPEYYLPLYLQSAKLAEPLQSGLLGLPFVVLEGVGGIASGLIIYYTGRYNALLWAGPVLMTLGVDLKSSTGLAKIIIYQVIGGLGSGVLIQPPLIAIQANVSQQQTATATSTLTFMRGLAQAVSIVIGGVVFQSSMNIKQSELVSAGLSHDLVMIFSGENGQATVSQLRSIQDTAQQHFVEASYAWNLRNSWILYAAIARITIGASYFAGSHPLSTEHVEKRKGLDERDSKRDRGTGGRCR